MTQPHKEAEGSSVFSRNDILNMEKQIQAENGLLKPDEVYLGHYIVRSPNYSRGDIEKAIWHYLVRRQYQGPYQSVRLSWNQIVDDDGQVYTGKDFAKKRDPNYVDACAIIVKSKVTLAETGLMILRTFLSL